MKRENKKEMKEELQRIAFDRLSYDDKLSYCKRPEEVELTNEDEWKIINKHLETTGAALWRKGYFDYALRADEDVKKAARYIIANPIRAGLCKSIYGYPHWDAIWIP